MSDAWAACLEIEDAQAIGRLRQTPGVKVYQDGQVVWLKGANLDEKLERSLRSLCGVRRFRVLRDGQLLPAGARVPQGRLPIGSWKALGQWLAVRLEGAAYAGRLENKARLRLVRCSSARTANVLATYSAIWTKYGDTAPQARLERLTFAVSRQSEAVVRGVPVPPLPGSRFVEDRGVATPAGWIWRPAVDADVVRELLKLQEDDLGLLYPDGSWDRLTGSDFVRASRSAIRMSWQRRDHD